MNMKIRFLFAFVLVMAGMSCSKTDDKVEKEPENPVVPVTPAEPEEPQKPEEDPSEATNERSPEAVKLLDYLKSIYGEKTLSGACTNVNWNTNEAQWVYKNTGKWPAINCFDFIHLPFAQPGGWIDYSNLKVVEDWHQAGGIVAIMWHWNVPANNGSDWSFYYGHEADKTTFDVRKIFDENSSEYVRMMKDIDQVG